MRRHLYDTIRFWVEKGIGGFRLDVIDQIAKDPDRKITAFGPHLYDFLRELSREAFCEEGLVTVGEAWSANVDRAKILSAPDGSQLSMVFQFEHIGLDQQPGKAKWDTAPLFLPALKECFSRWGNDGPYRVESAKMLAMMLHGMQGTPYIYQGEEIGMTNIRLPIEEYRDIEIKNLYAERLAAGYDPTDVMASIYARGRDNALSRRGRPSHRWGRTLRQDAPHKGF